MQDQQNFEIFNLAKKVYQQNGWTEFPELAARYGLNQCVTLIRDAGNCNLQALKDCLLLCVNLKSAAGDPKLMRRSSDLIRRLLEMGADPNTTVPRWSSAKDRKYRGLSSEGYSLLQCPILAHYLWAWPLRDGFSDDLKAILIFFISKGVDIKRKFVGFDP